VNEPFQRTKSQIGVNELNKSFGVKISQKEVLMNSEHRQSFLTYFTFHFRLIALVFLVLIAGSQRIATADDQGKSKFTTLDGAKIHYVDYGKGDDALILVHGWSQSVDAWRDQIPVLSKRNRVIALDLPGHGKSDKPEMKYTMDLFARAIDAVMRDAKVKRAVLVGHSMGTPVTRQFYRKYPEKTLGIVVVDGVLKPLGNPEMMNQLMAGLRSPNYKDVYMQMLNGMMGPAMTAELKERILASTGNTPQHVLVSAMEGMMDPSIWTDDKINVPVVAVMAKNPFYPPNVEEITRTLVPNLQFYMWQDVDHFLMMEKPKEFNAVVVEFLDKNELLKK
jgi:pimeloyl-ACP methyl ester carboxylesterase